MNVLNYTCTLIRVPFFIAVKLFQRIQITSAKRVFFPAKIQLFI